MFLILPILCESINVLAEIGSITGKQFSFDSSHHSSGTSKIESSCTWRNLKRDPILEGLEGNVVALVKDNIESGVLLVLLVEVNRESTKSGYFGLIISESSLNIVEDVVSKTVELEDLVTNSESSGFDERVPVTNCSSNGNLQVSLSIEEWCKKVLDVTFSHVIDPFALPVGEMRISLATTFAGSTLNAFTFFFGGVNRSDNEAVRIENGELGGSERSSSVGVNAEACTWQTEIIVTESVRVNDTGFIFTNRTRGDGTTVALTGNVESDFTVSSHISSLGSALSALVSISTAD
jgi:hypothetical protein